MGSEKNFCVQIVQLTGDDTLWVLKLGIVVEELVGSTFSTVATVLTVLM